MTPAKAASSRSAPASGRSSRAPTAPAISTASSPRPRAPAPTRAPPRSAPSSSSSTAPASSPTAPPASTRPPPAALLEPGACAAALLPAASPAEAFYLRAAIHGHHLVGDAPLAAALRDRAARLVIARAITPWGDPASERPLALVEAMMRGHGLDAYAHDLPPPS